MRHGSHDRMLQNLSHLGREKTYDEVTLRHYLNTAVSVRLPDGQSDRRDLDPLQTFILDITNTDSAGSITNEPPLRSVIPAQDPLHNVSPNDPWNPSIRHIEGNGMPQPMIALPSRCPTRKTRIVPLTIRIRNILRPTQKIKHRLAEPPSNSRTSRSIQLPAVENLQVPYTGVVDSRAVRFQAAAALAPDTNARGVDMRPVAFAGV